MFVLDSASGSAEHSSLVSEAELAPDLSAARFSQLRIGSVVLSLDLRPGREPVAVHRVPSASRLVLPCRHWQYLLCH